MFFSLATRAGKLNNCFAIVEELLAACFSGFKEP
jgi:hypothetical protein